MRQFNQWGIIIIPLFIILPFLVIALYNHPALDDWWYAEVYKQHGMLGAQRYWYNNYTARFFSNLIMTLAPLSWGWVEGYKLMPIVFIVCLFFSCQYISKTFFKSFTTHHFNLALWLTGTYLLIQRDYFECLYWLSANVVYQFNMLFFMLQLAVFYRILFLKEETKQKMLVVILLSIAITGSNETLGGLVLVEALVLLVYCFVQKSIRGFALLFVAMQLLCWLIMFAAPGNWNKVDVISQENSYTFSFIKAITQSFLSAGYYVIFLLKQPATWCLLFLSIPAWRFLVFKKLMLKSKHWFIIISTLSLGIAFTINFIAIYPTGNFIPPLRVTNIAMIFLFAGIALILTWLAETTFLLEKFSQLLQHYKTAVMCVCFLSATFTSPKYNQLLNDLWGGKARAYNKTMYARYKILKAASTDTCYLQMLTNVPRTIVATDVGGKVRSDIGYVFNKRMVVIMK